MSEDKPFTPPVEGLVERLQRELYDCLCYWGTLPEPEGDVPERYHRWGDLGEIAARLAALTGLRKPSGETDADSGMSGDAVERAEWAWAQLPTARKWTSLATHEKALACHTFARLSDSKPSGETGELVALMEKLSYWATPWRRLQNDHAPIKKLMREAADALARQAAEKERLNEALKRIAGQKGYAFDREVVCSWAEHALKEGEA